MLRIAFALLLLATTAHGQTTPVTEVNTAALTGPFDQSAGHLTYLTIHAPGAFSPASGLPQILVHMTFWAQDCTHLADLELCMTKDDSVVLDLRDLMSVGLDNERLDSSFDLSGYKGSWTAHAFQSDERCRDPGDLGYLLVPGAMNGTWSIATKLTNAAFGDRAQGLEVDEAGDIAVPDERFEALDVAFFQPDSLSMSSLILWAVLERAGDLPHEIGPTRAVIAARASTFDVQEVRLSLPDVLFGCALYSSLIPGLGNVIPEIAMPASSGFFRLSTPRFVEQVAITGEDVWIFGYHGQQLGPYGVGNRASYVNPISLAPTPTPIVLPTATASPVPSPTPDTTPTPVLTPVGTPTNLPSETPLPSPTPGDGSPTPIASPTPTSGALTPTPGASATPSATPSPSPGVTATPAATPTAGGSPSPLPSAVPTPSANPFGP